MKKKQGTVGTSPFHTTTATTGMKNTGEKTLALHKVREQPPDHNVEKNRCQKTR